MQKSEALYHIFWQDEAAQSEGDLFEELVVLSSGQIGGIAYQSSIEAALCKQQNLEWK